MILEKIDKSKIHSIKINDKSMIVNYWGCYFDEYKLIWNGFSHAWENLKDKNKNTEEGGNMGFLDFYTFILSLLGVLAGLEIFAILLLIRAAILIIIVTT